MTALFWPVTLPNVPLGHGIGLIPPNGQNDPAGHTKADNRPGDGQYWPGGHTLGQANAGTGQTKPVGHGNTTNTPARFQAENQK